MRTVLFTDSTHAAVGGIGSRHGRLAEALAARGWRPVFALTRGRQFHDPDAYRENLPAAEYVELDGTTGSSDGRRLAIRTVLRKLRPDIVLPGMLVDAWIVAEESKPAGGPRIVYGLPHVNRNALVFLREHARSIDAAYGTAPLTRDLLQSFCGLSAERTFLVPTGVRSCIEPASSEVAAPIRLLYVGRFDPDKRILDALSLADELVSRKVDFTLTLVGSGVQGPLLEAAVARLGDRLRLRAPVPAAVLYQEFYPKADAVLLFSPSEGLPNSLLEGMAHGLVAITADFVGRRELGLFHSGETAMVFDVGNLEAAATWIEDLVRNPGLKARIGANARQLIEQARSVGTMVDGFERVLETSLEGPSSIGPFTAPPEEGESRLRRILGPDHAERLKKILGRSFAHPDASEWPLIESIDPADPVLEDHRLQIAIASAERTESSPPT